MSIEYVILLLMVVGIVFIDYKLYKSLLTPAVIFSVPFLIAVTVLLLIGPKYGFPIISVDNILILCLGIFSFWFGSLLMILLRGKNVQKKQQREVFFSSFVHRRIIWYVAIIELITLLRYVMVIERMGLATYIALDGGSGAMVNGLGAHLMFSMYPFIPVIFSEGIKQRKYSYFFIVLLAILETFFTFTKYHVIFLVIACLIYLLNRNSKLLIPIAIVTIASSVLLFSLNYIINFMARKWVMHEDYLVNHFLNYVLGSIVYSTIAPNIMLGITDTTTLVMSQFTAIPNMFLRKMFLLEVFPSPRVPSIGITKYGERGNVMNLIAHMFSTHNYLVATIFFIILGFAITYWVYRSENLLMKTYLLTILLLSFFGSYFQLIVPWEILIYCAVLPKLFCIKFKKKMH